MGALNVSLMPASRPPLGEEHATCHHIHGNRELTSVNHHPPHVEHARLGLGFVDCGRSDCCDGRIGRLSGVASFPSVRVRRPAFHPIRLTLAVSLTLPSMDAVERSPVKQDGLPRRYQPMPLADLA